MASKLLTSLVAGSLVLSSSVAAAQTTGAPLDPAEETTLGSNGESALVGGDPEAVTAIIFGLIVICIAIWVNRGGDEDDDGGVGTPTSP